MTDIFKDNIYLESDPEHKMGLIISPERFGTHGVYLGGADMQILGNGTVLTTLRSRNMVDVEHDAIHLADLTFSTWTVSGMYGGRIYFNTMLVEADYYRKQPLPEEFPDATPCYCMDDAHEDDRYEHWFGAPYTPKNGRPFKAVAVEVTVTPRIERKDFLK